MNGLDEIQTGDLVFAVRDKRCAPMIGVVFNVSRRWIQRGPRNVSVGRLSCSVTDVFNGRRTWHNQSVSSLRKIE